MKQATKATYIRTSADPDVTLVIGGKTFQEYSHSLRTWSGYFDRALSSGMREEDTLEFDFPDRDPKEWEWIISLMAPMAEERVTMEKLSVALDWFDFLCSNLGLKACDKVLSQHLSSTAAETKELTISRSICQCGRIHSHHFPSALAPTPTIPTETKRPDITAEQLSLVMRNLGTVVQYNLEESKAVCFKTVRMALVNHATLITKDTLETITCLVKETVECRSHFFGPLKTHLPASISEEQADMLLANNMLHEMAFLQMQQDKHRLAQKRMVEVMEKQRRTDLTKTKKDFKQDSIWGPLVPDRWA